MKEQMTAKTQRRLIRLGDSEAITLPHHWVEGMQLKRGDVLTVLYNTDVVIKAPKREAQQ
jgi:antitoxin component of MazEF toxin-antitoxin module